MFNVVSFLERPNNFSMDIKQLEENFGGNKHLMSRLTSLEVQHDKMMDDVMDQQLRAPHVKISKEES
jgi:hypothetical protein